jgi:pyrroline-5-carboxylate reductase
VKALNLIGGGKMGSAILAGLLDAGHYQLSEVVVTVRSLATDSLILSRCPGVERSETVVEAETHLLAVKPAQVREVLLTMGEHKVPGNRLVSVAAGVTLASLEAWVGDARPVVRVMPNTAALVRRAISGITYGSSVTESDQRVVEGIFEAIGAVVVVAESQFDALMAVTGSGPAYVYLFLEALEDAGVQFGLQRTLARELALKMLDGAAQLAIQTHQPPQELRYEVTSPGGTTAAALHEFEAHGLRSMVSDALRACIDRAAALGRG